MLRKIALCLALAAGSAAPLAGSAQAAIGDGALGLSAAAAQLPVARWAARLPADRQAEEGAS